MLAALLVCAAFCSTPASASNNNNNDTLSVAMCGDIMMGTTFPSVQLPANDGADLFKDAGPVFRRADLAVGNLEGTLCDGGKSAKGEGPNVYSFRTPTTYVQWLKQAGFDFLSMANNHAHDFGEEGILSTERMLLQEDIKFAGIEGRTEIAVIERKGLRIGLCAFGHNSYTLKHTDLSTVGRILADLKQQADLIVVSFHGGAEGRTKSHLPHGTETFLGEDRGSLRELAHFCIDNGADIVYGHGPHVVRAVEVYNDRFVAYSLGNFCTPYGMNLTGISSYAPVIEVKIARDGRFLKGKIHSFLQQKGIGPRHDKAGSVAHEMKQLSEADVPHSQARIDGEGNISLK